MNNRIIYVSEEGMNRIREEQLSCKDVFMAEIDGTFIRTEYEYVRAMCNVFQVPYDIPMKYGWWCDVMSDLLWIEQKNIVLLIKNYEKLLCEDIKIKERIIRHIERILLPWWEYDVVGHMVGGEPRGFNIYISK